MHMPAYGFGRGIQNLNGLVPGRNGHPTPGGGRLRGRAEGRLPPLLRHPGGHGGPRGTAIAREDNYCEIDPDVVDKYGIPVLRFHYKWTDAEIKQAKHMQETFQSIMHEMGGIITLPDTLGRRHQLRPGGSRPGIIHEVGTVRMGDDPKKSALNKWRQAHDCPQPVCGRRLAVCAWEGDKNATLNHPGPVQAHQRVFNRSGQEEEYLIGLRFLVFGLRWCEAVCITGYQCVRPLCATVNRIPKTVNRKNNG